MNTLLMSIPTLGIVSIIIGILAIIVFALFILIKKKIVEASNVSSFIFKGFCITLMSLASITFIYVIIWMVLNSFRSWESFLLDPLNVFDFKDYTFDNYKQVFKYVYHGEKRKTFTYLQMLGNSVIHTTIGVTIGLIFEPLIGYVMAKFNFKHLNSILLIMIFISMTIPSIGSVYNTVKLMNVTLKLKNNWLNLILQLAGGINFSAIIYMNYFKNIPNDYAESAYIDGASEFKTYIKIYFVLAKPLLIATTVLRIIGFWNDYYSIFLYMPNKPTMAMGLWYIQQDFGEDFNYPPIFAALTLTSAISLLLYAMFSKQIMSSLAVGGVKG